MRGGAKIAKRKGTSPDSVYASVPAPAETPDLRAPTLPGNNRDDLRKEAAAHPPAAGPTRDRTPLGWVAWQPLRTHLERHPEHTRMFLNGYHPDGNDRYVGENSKHASQSQRTWVKKLIEAGMLKFDADNMPLEHLKAANPTAYYLDPRTPAGERQAFFKKVAERNREIQRRNQSEQEDREAQRTRRLRNVAAISLARPGPRSPNENKMITDALIHNKPGSYYDAIRFADQARRSRNSDAAPTRSSINFQREERAEPETTSKLPQTPSATINPFLLQRAETLVRAFLKDGDRGAPLRARAAELSIEELELALEIAPPEQRSFRAGLKNYIKERELSSVLYKEFAEKGSANLSGLRPRELAAIKRMATDVAHVTQHAGAQNFLKWLEQTV